MCRALGHTSCGEYRGKGKGMKRRCSVCRWLLLVALGAIGCAGGAGGGGEEYPGGRPVTLVAPAEPGSGWDTTARAMGEVLQQEGLIEHPLPIENRTGATGAVWLSQMVTERQGRDDVIAVTSLPIMSNKLRGDSEYGYEDVTMISRMITEYYMVAVPADSEYETAEDLLAAIEEDPDAVPVGAAGDDRLPMALLVKAAGGDPQSINFVAYEGGGEQIAAMLNGDIRAAVAGVSEFRGQIEAGDLRGLTVIRDERLAPPMDNIPTAREEGYDVELANWRGIYGPPDMPEEAVTYWQDTIQRMTETQAWEETAAKNQWETTYMEGEEFRNYLDETYESVRAGLRETGEIQ